MESLSRSDLIVNESIPDEFLLWGHRLERHSDLFYHLESHPRTAMLYSENAPLWLVRLQRVKPGEAEGPYWGFWNYASEFRGPARLSMVYPNRKLFDVCFPYGPEAVVEKGQGEIVNLRLIAAEERGLEASKQALGES